MLEEKDPMLAAKKKLLASTIILIVGVLCFILISFGNLTEEVED